MSNFPPPWVGELGPNHVILQHDMSMISQKKIQIDRGISQTFRSISGMCVGTGPGGNNSDILKAKTVLRQVATPPPPLTHPTPNKKMNKHKSGIHKPGSLGWDNNRRTLFPGW